MLLLDTLRISGYDYVSILADNGLCLISAADMKQAGWSEMGFGGENIIR